MSCLEMKCLSGIWKRILVLFAVFSMMIVSLPAYAERLPDFLAKVQPSEIFPGADRYGKPEGKPLVARVYKGEEQLGLVYITTDVVNTRGYSSKPIDTMIALANDGTIAGAKLVEHHEPIMLIGIPQSRVDKFIDKYIGLNFIKNPPKMGLIGQRPSECLTQKDYPAKYLWKPYLITCLYGRDICSIFSGQYNRC